MLYKFPFDFYTYLPISQHILDRAEIFGSNMLLQLLFRQPLEIAQSKQVIFQIRLSCHDTCFHEKCLLANCSFEGLFVEVRIDDVVACWDAANDPRVHVQAGGLD